VEKPDIQILAFAGLSQADRQKCRKFVATAKGQPSAATLETDGNVVRLIFECRLDANPLPPDHRPDA
jgi:hypothetical protein